VYKEAATAGKKALYHSLSALKDDQIVALRINGLHRKLQHIHYQADNVCVADNVRRHFVDFEQRYPLDQSGAPLELYGYNMINAIILPDNIALVAPCELALTTETGGETCYDFFLISIVARTDVHGDVKLLLGHIPSK
jgi:hypothetical protein